MGSWLTYVIPGIWEAEIRRIIIQGQSRQIVHKTPSPKLSEQSGFKVWLAFQAQSSEFKPQSHQKKKKKSHFIKRM
jgi:hypothetical protein